MPITREGASFDADQPVVADRRGDPRAPADLDRARLERDQPGRDRPADPPGEEPQGRPPLHRRPARPQERAPARRSRRRGLPPLPGPDPDRDRRGREPARPLRGHLPTLCKRRHRSREPVPGLGLHRRQHRNISERMLAIRDGGLAQLGDTTPGDGVMQGNAPAITSPASSTSADPRHRHLHRPRRRGHPHDRGHDRGPLLSEPDGLPAGLALQPRLGRSAAADPGQRLQARFGCNIPRSAVRTTAAAAPQWPHRRTRRCTGTACSASTRGLLGQHPPTRQREQHGHLRDGLDRDGRRGRLPGRGSRAAGPVEVRAAAGPPATGLPRLRLSRASDRPARRFRRPARVPVRRRVGA